MGYYLANFGKKGYHLANLDTYGVLFSEFCLVGVLFTVFWQVGILFIELDFYAVFSQFSRVEHDVERNLFIQKNGPILASFFVCLLFFALSNHKFNL